MRCVIAAGWAVDDDAASEFATVFYASLLRGKSFIDAVGDARAAAYEYRSDVNTWAAYQCYGDPDWQFRPNVPDANQVVGGGADDFAFVASATSLQLELERIFVQTRFQGYDPATQVNQLQKLEKTLERLFEGGRGKIGKVAELFGEAYFEAGAMESAIRWCERAVNAPDGKASMRAAEQLGNARSRFAWETVEKALRHRDEMSRQRVALELAKTPVATAKARTAARRALSDAETKLNLAIVEARKLIQLALTGLDQLVAFRPTMERHDLLASAYKRRALVDTAAGQSARARQDLIEMKKCYEHALEVGRTEQGADLYYPASNCLAAEVTLGAGKPRLRLDPKLRDLVKKHLDLKSGINADFWSVVGDIELRQYEAIAARNLGGVRAKLERAYKNLHERAKSPRMWSSVYDTAYLVLESFRRAQSPAAKTSGKARMETDAAEALLAMLRAFAHTEDGQ